MPSAWVAAPQDTLLHQVTATLDDPRHSGVTLTGADGVGKTLSTPRRGGVRATAALDRRSLGDRAGQERVIPFGAFRTLLADADLTESGRPPELLRAAHDYLTGDDVRQLFVVDDAHHLDLHLSATLVYQLALRGSARLISLIVQRDGAELPDAVAALRTMSC